VLTSIVTSDPQLLEPLITPHQPASNSNNGAPAPRLLSSVVRVSLENSPRERRAASTAGRHAVVRLLSDSHHAHGQRPSTGAAARSTLAAQAAPSPGLEFRQSYGYGLNG
jgi:hypothetical protein